MLPLMDGQNMVFPAPAGMNRHEDDWVQLAPGVPRASGDEPHLVTGETLQIKCSPRQRG